MRLFTLIFLLLMLPSLSFADCSNRVESIQSIGDMKAAFRCLNNEIKRLEQKLKQGGAGTVVVNPMPNLPTPTISKTITHQEIKYDLLGCGIKNEAVVCELRVTRLGADKRIQISRETEFYDENGNEHSASSIQIGSSYSKYSAVKKLLISNIPTKIILRFKGVSPQATRITILRILDDENGNWISLRNIALKR